MDFCAFVSVNLTGNKGRVDMSNFELLKVLGTGGKRSSFNLKDLI